jgi:hypothetical protein
MNYSEKTRLVCFTTKRLEIRFIMAREKDEVPNHIAEIGKTEVKNK